MFRDLIEGDHSMTKTYIHNFSHTKKTKKQKTEKKTDYDINILMSRLFELSHLPLGPVS